MYKTRKMKLLMLDNYDSFTFNLVQLIRENSDYRVDVRRNDEISITEVDQYDKIMLSPGPGIPSEAGILCELIDTYKSRKSIFGVCLGLQAIAEVFGARLFNLAEPLHGISTPVSHTSSPLFEGIPGTFQAGRYHSWAVQNSTVPDGLSITARDENDIIMALEHTAFDVSGVQFHPESILTDHGKQIIINFLKNK